MKAVFLKVYKIHPLRLPIKPEYHGCKSWININAQIPVGESVLGDQEIESKLKKFKEVIK